MAITLAHRALKLATPLGEDALLPERIEIVERVSQPFVWVADLLSEQADLSASRILGREVTLTVPLSAAGSTRSFQGIVTEFSQTGYRRRLHEYRAVVRPWFWFLTRTADCRTFQSMSVPDIFKAVVSEHGFSDFRLSLHETYDPWDYCVQYRETDFNFLSRLLEHEGIHYHFECSGGRHVMVLSDDSTALGPQHGTDAVPYFTPEPTKMHSPGDHLEQWSVTEAVVSGAYATTDYDFRKPVLSLRAYHDAPRDHAENLLEIFDFPAAGSDTTTSESMRLAKIRLDELQNSYRVARGSGDALGLAAGARFKLQDHPRADFNQEYFVTATTHLFKAGALDAGVDTELEGTVSLEAVDSKSRFRPSRVTPKPVIQGAQTAVVVGKSGEEIDTDKHGRVRVHFPWDRHDKRNETSSCWVRVAQVWAGKNWGAIHIPRIGQEVLVSFLEGDPDRPIITGRVYNGDQAPPYDLPSNATQSGIKTRSSKGGSVDNCNEIRFEDRKGSEELFFHAEKDLKTEVENDQSITVGHDETVEIKNDRTATVDGNETCTVKKDHSTTIKGKEDRDVTGDRTTKITGNDKLTVQQSQSSDVTQKFTLKAGQEIVLETGASKLTMKADGTIELAGVQIKITGNASVAVSGQAKLELTSSGTSKLAGSMTSVKGAMLDLKADGIATLKGSLTMIG